MPDLPLSDFGVDAITQAMIRALKQVASAENQSSIIMYNNTLASIKGQNMWLASQNLPPLPIPPPPMIKIVDEDLVKQLESESGIGQIPKQDDRWGKVFLLIQYVPIVPPAPVALPVIIGAETIYYPGFFDTVSGDGPAVPIGTVVNQTGHSYRKTIIGHSPFAPDGNITRWQQ